MNLLSSVQICTQNADLGLIQEVVLFKKYFYLAMDSTVQKRKISLIKGDLPESVDGNGKPKSQFASSEEEMQLRMDDPQQTCTKKSVFILWKNWVLFEEINLISGYLFKLHQKLPSTWNKKITLNWDQTARQVSGMLLLCISVTKFRKQCIWQNG